MHHSSAYNGQGSTTTTMKTCLCFAALIAVALAVPQQFGNQYRQPSRPYQPQQRPQTYQPPQQPYNSAARPVVPILAYSNDVNHDGSYSFNYQTGDGTAAQERGYVKNPGNKDLEAQVAEGSYSYTGTDGQVYTVNYIADENGFRAEGAHLPTPPPVPEAIQRSLDYIARSGNVQQQSYRPQQQQQQQYFNKPRF